jgi:hypothetical protein
MRSMLSKVVYKHKTLCMSVLPSKTAILDIFKLRLFHLPVKCFGRKPETVKSVSFR